MYHGIRLPDRNEWEGGGIYSSRWLPWDSKAGLQIPGVPETSTRYLWSQNYFYKKIKMLFACFIMLMFTLTVQKQRWVKRLAQAELRQWNRIVLMAIVFFLPCVCSYKTCKYIDTHTHIPVSLNTHDEAIKIVNMIECQPLCTHLFALLCDKCEVCFEHFRCVPKHGGYHAHVKEKILTSLWASRWIGCSFHGTLCIWKEDWQTNRLLQPGDVADTFLKMNEVNLSFPGKTTGCVSCQW